MAKKKGNEYGTGIPKCEYQQDKYDIELPQSVVESFARFLVPEIRKFYASEQGQREFAEWQAMQEKEKKSISELNE